MVWVEKHFGRTNGQDKPGNTENGKCPLETKNRDINFIATV